MAVLIKLFISCTLIFGLIFKGYCQSKITLDVSHGRVLNEEYIPICIKISNKSDSVINIFIDKIFSLNGYGMEWYGWGGKLYDEDEYLNDSLQVLREVESDFDKRYFFITKFGIYRSNKKDYLFYNNILSLNSNESKKIKALIKIDSQEYEKLKKGNSYNVKIIYNTDGLLRRFPKIYNYNFTKNLKLHGDFVLHIN
jgi:hypothetical protein